MGVAISSPGLAEHVAITYDEIHSNTLAVVATAVPLVDRVWQCAEVVVQNDATSANNMRVGNAARQDVVLQPGHNITIPINDLSKVYVISAWTSTVNWIAVE